MVAALGCNATLAPSCSAEGNVVVEGDRGAKPGQTAGAAGADACPGPARTGTTGCFPGTCGPGQYCDDRASECRAGCVTDLDCGPRDVCTRAADAIVGRCESCSGFQFAPAAEGCVVPGRSGVTPCFPGDCPEGQYCIDSGIPHCQPGCVSDENCGPAERCSRADGAAVGMCTSCFVATPR